jgi:hypothetical protein
LGDAEVTAAQKRLKRNANTHRVKVMWKAFTPGEGRTSREPFFFDQEPGANDF